MTDLYTTLRKYLDEYLVYVSDDDLTSIEEKQFVNSIPDKHRVYARIYYKKFIYPMKEINTD